MNEYPYTSWLLLISILVLDQVIEWIKRQKKGRK